jgi:hypothetical protein
VSASSPEAAVAAELLGARLRQLQDGGFEYAHEDEEGAGQLALAAAALCAQASYRVDPLAWLGRTALQLWPWVSLEWDQDRDPRESLVMAGAYVIAEIERLDRAKVQELHS